MASPFGFRLEARSRECQARAGVFRTPHGDVPTPFFMPVGTRGSVKGIHAEDLARVGTRVVLANTYHLHLRPGHETVRELGGLHAFMGWNGPILTDSGGYQLFSLREVTSIDEGGATVKSIVDGTPIRLTPESVVDIQLALGPDVLMAFDHCPADPSAESEVQAATERTHRWLERCVRRWREQGGESDGHALFGIVQGGGFPELRKRSVEAVLTHDLPGYAVGGVSVGEDQRTMQRAVAAATPLLPEDRPRYLMGVGLPRDFLAAIALGIDMFDCVTPTRHGRTHQAFTSRGRINLRNRIWARDDSPLDPSCDCPTCSGYSKGYLRHLAKAGEMLAAILLTLHNLRFFHMLMEQTRAAILADRFEAWRAEVEEMDPVRGDVPA